MAHTIKYTSGFLDKLENLITESDYALRYEKGNFKSGYCVLREQKIMIVNKFYTVEGKINVLLDIIDTLSIDTHKLTDKTRLFYEKIPAIKMKN